ncbi:hypothetical protein JL475_24470 [Streptomyces sp. M2CJ-2]|uniref:hypothetical protein n=1 Tax=Streptomyces sp. M2CJ-2 TaxID=2803948 RepID=UPI001926EE62|nr:hypothetical protein [Streptomyces sp. M2CJ-2]MBL3669091.1 hypothetical protein [Streptomyces sp. M2CJ-2]
MNRDDQIAALLEAGTTYLEIQQQLRVSYGTVRRVRDDRRIPLPPGRAKRSRSELDAVEQQAIDMLTSGATVEQACAATRLTRNKLAWLRREHRIPVPERDLVAGQRRTVEEAFVLYATPTADGHALWTGTMSGRMPQLYAEGRRLNARHVAFERHHGHSPTGYVRAVCTEAACIDGAHLADAVMRGTAPARSGP